MADDALAREDGDCAAVAEPAAVRGFGDGGVPADGDADHDAEDACGGLDLGAALDITSEDVLDGFDGHMQENFEDEVVREALDKVRGGHCWP